MYSKENFAEEVNTVFNLSWLSKPRSPIEVAGFDFQSLPSIRLNHYLVKKTGTDEYCLGDIDLDEVRNFIDICNNELETIGLSVSDRYCYITLDQKWVEPGETQRTPGWHIDGMQGDEVTDKVPGDITFLWCNALPTKFANQSFDISGLDPSSQNVFKFLGKQVKNETVVVAETKKIYLVGPYHVHEATEAKERVYRIFLRVSYTNTPITSVKMTFNPSIEYNYKYHTTSGNIPEHLK